MGDNRSFASGHARDLHPARHHLALLPLRAAASDVTLRALLFPLPFDFEETDQPMFLKCSGRG